MSSSTPTTSPSTTSPPALCSSTSSSGSTPPESSREPRTPKPMMKTRRDGWILGEGLNPWFFPLPCFVLIWLVHLVIFFYYFFHDPW
jgi:hypothetical protein